MAEAEAAPAEQSALKIIDWEEAMTQVGGDEEFLNEVLQDLLTGETTIATQMKGDRGLGGGGGRKRRNVPVGTFPSVSVSVPRHTVFPFLICPCCPVARVVQSRRRLSKRLGTPLGHPISPGS